MQEHQPSDVGISNSPTGVAAIMADLDLQAVHDEMVAIAYEAGRMILSANPADLDTGTKLNCMSGRKEA